MGCGVWGEVGCGVWGSGEVGKWGSGEVGKWGSCLITLSPYHPITPKPYHPKTLSPQNPISRLLNTDSILAAIVEKHPLLTISEVDCRDYCFRPTAYPRHFSTSALFGQRVRR
ncbi:MAG: hypothetical protein EWV67_08660 [Microcystis sp. M_QC_C_20170808_M2Col]|nr:MAG: hypothetical protein EWV67_08660 [Microcystis sp. M_QC_C_20170808_M2Col]TRT70726.1 MAG: hypothetical protein EWV68_06290 [Microcystis sp. M_QC_C_20170808_M9Col]